MMIMITHQTTGEQVVIMMLMMVVVIMMMVVVIMMMVVVTMRTMVMMITYDDNWLHFPMVGFFHSGSDPSHQKGNQHFHEV